MSSKYLYHLTAFIFFFVYYTLGGLLNTYKGRDFIVFLNVGQGDSVLISSNQSSLLVDSGPSSHSLFNLKNYLYSKKPQFYVATHLHSDHISGFWSFLPLNPYIISKYNPVECTGVGYTEINCFEKMNALPLTYINNLQIGNFTVKLLYPSSTELCTNSDLNMCSIALLLEHRPTKKKILLLADNPIDAQSNYAHQVDDVYVIKVPHHGSANSLNTTLLQNSKPAISIISVGKNSYGLPSKVVIDYYKSIGSKVLRTDREGDIVIDF